MSDMLKSGDSVVMVDCAEADLYPNTVWRTRSEPWALGHGQLVIALEGRAGGFAIDRLKKVEADPTPIPPKPKHSCPSCVSDKQKTIAAAKLAQSEIERLHHRIFNGPYGAEKATEMAQETKAWQALERVVRDG